MNDEPSTPPATTFEARALLAASLAQGEAALAQRRAAEQLLMSTGNTMLASSAYLLWEAANGLLHELGEQFTALRESPDPEVRRFVTDILTRLHGAPQPDAAPSNPAASA